MSVSTAAMASPACSNARDPRLKRTRIRASSKALRAADDETWTRGQPQLSQRVEIGRRPVLGFARSSGVGFHGLQGAGWGGGSRVRSARRQGEASEGWPGAERRGACTLSANGPPSSVHCVST
eukprot:6211737-Pleurochrysis_carterae.AAC.1